MCVRIFEHIFDEEKESDRRNTRVFQGSLTQYSSKFAENTCAYLVKTGSYSLYHFVQINFLSTQMKFCSILLPLSETNKFFRHCLRSTFSSRSFEAVNRLLDFHQTILYHQNLYPCRSDTLLQFVWCNRQQSQLLSYHTALLVCH